MDAEVLSERWSLRWPECEPLADQLRERVPDRWVRFHSLPGSKRYAENAGERAVILQRHHEVLRWLGAQSVLPVITVTAQFSDSLEPPAQLAELALVQPGAWHWRAIADEVDAANDGWTWHLFVNEMAEADLDGLLMLASDDGCRGVMVAPPDLAWICHPYDGGIDVLARSTREREALRVRFVDWLSPHESGL